MHARALSVVLAGPSTVASKTSRPRPAPRRGTSTATSRRGTTFDSARSPRGRIRRRDCATTRRTGPHRLGGRARRRGRPLRRLPRSRLDGLHDASVPRAGKPDAADRQRTVGRLGDRRVPQSRHRRRRVRRSRRRRHRAPVGHRSAPPTRSERAQIATRPWRRGTSSDERSLGTRRRRTVTEAERLLEKKRRAAQHPNMFEVRRITTTITAHDSGS